MQIHQTTVVSLCCESQARIILSIYVAEREIPLVTSPIINHNTEIHGNQPSSIH